MKGSSAYGLYSTRFERGEDVSWRWVGLQTIDVDGMNYAN